MTACALETLAILTGAGVFFALEVILRNFPTRSFGLVVLSTGSSCR